MVKIYQLALRVLFRVLKVALPVPLVFRLYDLKSICEIKIKKRHITSC